MDSRNASMTSILFDNLYSFKDVVADRYGPLFHARNNGVALRNFKKLVNDVDLSSKNDFQLYHMGKWDEVTGLIIINDVPIKIGDSKDFVEVKK
nr:MAG: nonstructural protein [Microvirus sp.]